MAKHLDNIIALASAPGPSALALIRLSGANLKYIYKQITKKKAINRRATYSKIYDPNNNLILDESVITYFQKPHSFTGEDIIEISCHGGGIIANRIIKAIILLGARHAKPGEFSLRAFYNEKIDLLQAESINELIKSKNQISTEVGLNHLGGLPSKKIKKIKEKTINLLSIIEHELDFSENEIDCKTQNEIEKDLKEIKEEIEIIINSTLFGREISEGYRIAIIGKPNAGKSSLFNSILGKERAIISNIKGTTRDTIEAPLNINGIPIILIDTAGLWNSKNEIDIEAINNSKNEIKKAHICLILDEENPKKILKNKLIKNIEKHYVLIKTKQDNYAGKNKKEIVYVSVNNHIGINILLTRLSTLLTTKSSLILNKESVFLSTRQFSLLKTGLDVINNAIYQCAANHSTDIIASTLQSFAFTMDELVGKINNKDVINNIFSNFCVGK